MTYDSKLLATIARSKYVERCHLNTTDLREINGCPGLLWVDEDETWNNMSIADKQAWLDDAVLWLDNVKTNMPYAYEYLMENWREVDVYPVT